MDGQQGQQQQGQPGQGQQQQQICFARSISCVEDVHASPSQRSSAALLLLLQHEPASHLSPCYASHPTTLLLSRTCGSPGVTSATNNSPTPHPTTLAAEIDSGDWATWTGRQASLSGTRHHAAESMAATDHLNNHCQQQRSSSSLYHDLPTHPSSGQCIPRDAAAGAYFTPALFSPSNTSSPTRCTAQPSPSLPPTPPTPSRTTSEPLSCLESLDSPMAVTRSLTTPSMEHSHDPLNATSHATPFLFAPSSAYTHADVQQLISNEVVRGKALSPSPACLANHHVDEAMRCMTVSWMAEAVGACNLQRATLFHAVSYLDRFLTTSKDVTVGMLQLVATACLAIASKQVEAVRPSHEEWVFITDQSFTAADLGRMEWLVVTYLSWRLRNPTPLSFMVLYCCGLPAGGAPAVQVPAVAQYLLELALLQYGMLRYTYPVLAAASLVVAQELLAEADRQLPAPAPCPPAPAEAEAEAGAAALAAALLALDPTLEPAAVRCAAGAVRSLYREAAAAAAGGGTAAALVAPVQDVYRSHLPQNVLPYP